LLLCELINLVEPGNDEGHCFICGRETKHGWRETPSSAFTAWAQIYAGDVICEHCRPLLKNRSFRLRSWIATGEAVHFMADENRDWMWEAFIEPPSPPFAWYITVGRQKQGWISIMRYVNESPDGGRYWIGTDFTDKPVLMEITWARQAQPLIAELRSRKLPKTAIKDGAYSPSHYRRAIEEGWEELLERAREYAGDPRWEVMVHVAR